MKKTIEEEQFEYQIADAARACQRAADDLKFALRLYGVKHDWLETTIDELEQRSKDLESMLD